MDLESIVSYLQGADVVLSENFHSLQYTKISLNNLDVEGKTLVFEFIDYLKTNNANLLSTQQATPSNKNLDDNCDNIFPIHETPKSNLDLLIFYLGQNYKEIPKCLTTEDPEPEFEEIRFKRPTDKSKKHLFKILSDLKLEQYIDNCPRIGYSEPPATYYLINDYLKAFDECHDSSEVAEILNIGFNKIHRTLDRILTSNSMNLLGDLLKEKPKYPRFYDLVKTLFDFNFSIDEYHEVLNSIRGNNELRLDYVDYIKELLKDISKELSGERERGFNSLGLKKYFDELVEKGDKRVLNALKTISHNEVKDLDEFKELTSLSIQNYLPVAVIGQGKTRRVYKVIYEPREQVLALKLDIPEDKITHQRAKAFFKLHSQGDISKRERKALTDLTHENLARMWDFGEYYDTNFSTRRKYVVEDYVDGTTLEDLVKEEGPLDHEKFILVFGQILRAIKYLGERRYIHRDIKPDNILISHNFRTKLTDLQNAVKANESGEYIGESFGAIRTMAPELILENRASFSSDLYSIGVCMYYALIGEMPFEYGEFKDLTELKQKVREEQSDPTQRKRIEQEVDRYIVSFFQKTLLSPKNPNAMDVIDKTSKLLSFDPDLRTEEIGSMFEELDRLYNHVIGHPINY